MVRKQLLVGIVVAGWVVGMARAALIVPVQQTLSGSSFVGQADLRADDRPPDVLVGNVYGTQTVSTKSEHLNYPITFGAFEGETRHIFASASMTTTVRGDSISAAAATDFEDHNEVFGSSNADARVAAKITFDVTQSATFNLAVNTMYYSMSWVKLTGPAGELFRETELGWAMTWPPFEPAQARVTLALDPGQYVLDIRCETVPHMSSCGAGTMDFSLVAVPEPGALGVVVMGVGLLRVRRRG